MKKIVLITCLFTLVNLFPISTVKAGVVERTLALENLASAEIRVYVGNNGFVGMDGSQYNEKAAHPSMLYRLADTKAKNDNSLIGSTDELLKELNLLGQSITGLIAEDDDFTIIEQESLAATGFTFRERLDILKEKMEIVNVLLSDCGINNNYQKQKVMERVESIISALLYYLDYINPPPLNNPPVLTPIGDKTVEEGQTLTFTIFATDSDGNDLIYTAYDLPAGANFNSATRAFSWTPGYDQAGTYLNVHFEVFDGELYDSEDITIIVVDVPNG